MAIRGKRNTTKTTGNSLATIKAWRAKFPRSTAVEVPLPNALDLNVRQQRQLLIAVIIALIAGVYLVGKFFSIIVLSLLAAILFEPVYRKIEAKLKRPGTAAMLTFIIMLLVIIIPLTFVVILTIGQVEHLINQLTHLNQNVSISDAAKHLLDSVNRFLKSATNGQYQLSAEHVRNYLATAAAALASWFLGALTSSFSGVANFVTEFILFIYLFTALLVHKARLLKTLQTLNPLGKDVSALYVSRTGQMAKGVVGGQLVIALCQGVVEALILRVVGLGYFFFFATILTLLSIIPLGGGILAIPIGIIMILTGHIWQGIVVLLGHFVIITNIDNVLRPHLVPRAIRMNSAFMMLAVFGGLGLFGFLGLFIGPIIMILVLSTLQIYLPLAEAQQEAPTKKA